MRRLAILVAALAALALAGIGMFASASSSDEPSGRIDVIFDDARGLVPGQLVQVAGARVGTITKVSVTPRYRARIHMEVDGRFVPFGKDAQCTIKPQGLIAENYVQCDPGTPERGPLEGRRGGVPTVPVGQTTQPVSLTDLFEVWNTPTTDRLQVLFSMLGLSTSGRGEDFNGLLRRLNPSLALVRRTIAILDRQRDDLAATVDDTGEVVEAIARRPRELEALIRHAGRVSSQTGSQAGALGEGVRRLPALLEQATPALRRLDEVLVAGKPLLDQFEVAAPDINRIGVDLPRLAKVARPALRKLRPVLVRGAKAATRTVPVTRVMREYAKNSLPSAQTAGSLFPLLENNGFNGNLLGFFYNATLASARYDGISHIIPAHVGLTSCAQYATTPDPDCGAQAATASAPRARERRRSARRAAPGATRPPVLEALLPGAPADASPAAPSPSRQAPARPLQGGTDAVPPPVKNLLEFLLG